MGRVWKEWTDRLVATYNVAPHRYLWSGSLNHSNQIATDPWEWKTYKDAKANYAYAPGEVVYVFRNGVPTKALIVDQLVHERNLYSERQECYRVVVETAKGQWSKLWEKVYPGFIQRGYKAAGLAPDVLD